MGTLRFLLAISVYLVHSHDLWGGIRFVKAGIAVEAFFIISGFYMALILSEKYLGNTGYRLFYINRFLRLFPASGHNLSSHINNCQKLRGKGIMNSNKVTYITIVIFLLASVFPPHTLTHYPPIC